VPRKKKSFTSAKNVAAKIVKTVKRNALALPNLLELASGTTS
jgi:hypothetical protein